MTGEISVINWQLAVELRQLLVDRKISNNIHSRWVGCCHNCPEYVWIWHSYLQYKVTTTQYEATLWYGWTINETHSLKNRPRCYVKSPTAQDTCHLANGMFLHCFNLCPIRSFYMYLCKHLWYTQMNTIHNCTHIHTFTVTGRRREKIK